jgi:hypothetical protein
MTESSNERKLPPHTAPLMQRADAAAIHPFNVSLHADSKVHDNAVVAHMYQRHCDITVNGIALQGGR